MIHNEAIVGLKQAKKIRGGRVGSRPGETAEITLYGLKPASLLKQKSYTCTWL
jgi:hypothetical protein